MTIDTLAERPGGQEASRAKRLRAATHGAHEILDRRIMSADPFGSVERYGLFLLVQHDFHLVIDRFYFEQDLKALIPDLSSRRRLMLIREDIVDIGGTPPALAPRDDYVVDVPAALGWLYVAEGSNLGAAFLLKEARNNLGLSASHGARHLAGHSDGRGLHWRTFTAALDAAALSTNEEWCVIEGARQAFGYVLKRVEEVFP